MLSDKNKRAVYDQFGEEGLEVWKFDVAIRLIKHRSDLIKSSTREPVDSISKLGLGILELVRFGVQFVHQLELPGAEVGGF